MWLPVHAVAVELRELALTLRLISFVIVDYARMTFTQFLCASHASVGNDSNLLIVFYVQIMPDDLVMQLHRF